MITLAQLRPETLQAAALQRDERTARCRLVRRLYRIDRSEEGVRNALDVVERFLGLRFDTLDETPPGNPAGYVRESRRTRYEEPISEPHGTIEEPDANPHPPVLARHLGPVS